MSGATVVELLLIGVAAVIVAEMLARVLLPRLGRYYVWQPGRRVELHLDRATHPQLEPVVLFETNGDGERGAPPPSGADRTLRVLATGGSTVESFLLNHETSWPGALERQLSSQRALAALGVDGVHVGNIGKSGVGAAALDLILARVLPRFPRADILLVMVGASDVLLWLESGGTVVPKASVDDYFAWHPAGPFGWKPRQTALVRLLRRLRDSRRSGAVERRDRVAKWIGNARTMRANAAEIRDETPDPSAMLDAFERGFRGALQHARAHADRVVVVRQPWFEKADFTPEERALLWNGGVGKAINQNVTIFYSDAVIFRLMRAMDERAARVAAELGVEQLDLMPILERSTATYYDHFHHTPAGAAMIASAVADVLLNRVPVGVDMADRTTRDAQPPIYSALATGEERISS